MIGHVLDTAREVKPRSIGAVIGHQREQVREALAGAGVDFVVQEIRLRFGVGGRGQMRGGATHDAVHPKVVLRAKLVEEPRNGNWGRSNAAPFFFLTLQNIQPIG